MKPFQGLEVVIPKRFPKKQIPRILQQHEAWITLQLQKHQHSLQEIDLPETIDSAFFSTEWKISYQINQQPGVLETDQLLVIQHSTKQQATKLLRHWIRNKAKEILPCMLENIANEFNFEFNKTTIRSQKSRWGSCSSSGTISLNDQLLFMPADTVRYLMIHELCHTRFMNHSTQFWNLVEHCCANYKFHDRQLSTGREHVPAWFSASLYHKNNQP